MTMTAKDVEWIKLLMQDTISLNQQIKHTEDGEEVDELGSFIVDPDPGPEEICIRNERDKRLDNYLNEFLSPQQVKVLRMRYGLDDGHCRTLDSIGKELGISRERIRQIEATALRRLRGKFYSRKITMEDL